MDRTRTAHSPARRHTMRPGVEPIDDRSLSELSEFFKVFGDATRLRIIHALTRSALCVQEIADLLEMNQSAISHQLRILKQARLVKNHRSGRSIRYSLDDVHVQQIYRQGLEHVHEPRNERI